MTIRAKVLWFAAVSVVMVSFMGGMLIFRAQQGRTLRLQLTAIQDQVDSYDRLRVLAWPFLNQLAQARQTDADTVVLQRGFMSRVDEEMDGLLDSLMREGDGFDARSAAFERAEHMEMREALLKWSTHAEERMREMPASTSVEPSVAWLLYAEFDRGPDKRIKEIQLEEQAELEELKRQMDTSVAHTRLIASILPCVSLVLMAAFATAILLPLRRSLLELTRVAGLIGRGDFDIHTQVQGEDELGMLARAFDRMARELRGSLEEKQRLVRAEAETAEREARRYHVLLEETVAQRTAQLGESNARLQESLQQLQATQEQLLSADRLASIGRLAASVGHEINNPLAFILSNLRYVHQELSEPVSTPPDEESRQEMLQALSEASEGAERVRLIVQDLKTLARPDDMALGAVDVASVVRSSAKMARHETRDKARLVEECEGVPPVRANAARLGQVFLNLFINAAHAIPPGRSQENEIRVMARLSAPQQVTVEVRDTGAGIPAEHLRRIFDPFFTTKPVGVGTGLGLSVCHRIITAFGGEIRVESELGRGTSFFLLLQVDEGARASTQSAA